MSSISGSNRLRSLISYQFIYTKFFTLPRFLTKQIYEITKEFPVSEKFGIVSQLQRAVVSICSNIAEGSSRISKKDQAHFYNIAFSSLMESLNQLIIANDLGYLKDTRLIELRKEIHVISIMLNNLKHYAIRKQPR